MNKWCRGWLTQAWKKEDADERIIQLQQYCIIALLVLTVILLIGWSTAPSRLTVYIPPDIQNGSTLKAGAIPEPLIYSFAYEIWQELNYWPNEGGEPYVNNIKTYWSYLTPQFKNILLEDYAELKATGQVQRTRFSKA